MKKDVLRQTWQHPRGEMKAMLDLIIARSTPLFEFTDVKVSRKAEANFDHYLVTVYSD